MEPKGKSEWQKFIDALTRGGPLPAHVPPPDNLIQRAGERADKALLSSAKSDEGSTLEAARVALREVIGEHREQIKTAPGDVRTHNVEVILPLLAVMAEWDGELYVPKVVEFIRLLRRMRKAGQQAGEEATRRPEA
jgi:hypothetical protein